MKHVLPLDEIKEEERNTCNGLSLLDIMKGDVASLIVMDRTTLDHEFNNLWIVNIGFYALFNTRYYIYYSSLSFYDDPSTTGFYKKSCSRVAYLHMAVRLNIIHKDVMIKYKELSAPCYNFYRKPKHNKFMNRTENILLLGFNPNRKKCHCGNYAMPRWESVGIPQTTTIFLYRCSKWDLAEASWSQSDLCDFKEYVKPKKSLNVAKRNPHKFMELVM